MEIGGALKNIIAIAAGVVQGIGLGHNSMALITRGLAEISGSRALKAGDVKRSPVWQVWGILFLTCTGDLSRNRRVEWNSGVVGNSTTF